MAIILSSLNLSGNQTASQYMTEKGVELHTLDDRGLFYEHVQNSRKYDALIIGFKEIIDQKVLDEQPHLTVIGTISTGVDHIDMNLCSSRNIPVVTVKSINAYAVAEHTLAQLFYFLKLLPESHAACLAGSDRSGLPSKTTDIKGRIVGIMGSGSTAQELAWRLVALGAKVVIWARDIPKAKSIFSSEPSIKFTSHLEDLFSMSDIVSVNVSLNNNTKNIITDAFIKKLPEGACLINNTRAEVISNDAVNCIADQRKDIALAVDSMDICSYFPRIQKIQRLLLTPHTAGISSSALEAMETYVVKKVLEFL